MHVKTNTQLEDLAGSNSHVKDATQHLCYIQEILVLETTESEKMCFIDQSEARFRTFLILPFGITASPRPLGTALSASTSVKRYAAALQVPTLLCSSRTKTKALHNAVPSRQFAS